MGLGVVRRGSAAQVGSSLTDARDLAHRARKLPKRGVDPIDERDRRRDAECAAEAARKTIRARDPMTLASAARDYHERVIETNRTARHAAQWIASLENHAPPEIWHTPIAGIEAPALLAALSKIRALEESGERVPEALQRLRAAAGRCDAWRGNGQGRRSAGGDARSYVGLDPARAGRAGRAAGRSGDGGRLVGAAATSKPDDADTPPAVCRASASDERPLIFLCDFFAGLAMAGV